MSEGAEARRFLRGRRHGVLSTLSRRHDGYPFGSVVPFVLDHEARPAIFISRLAEHTRNIEADSRVSLLVNDAGDDVQAGARLTLLGDAARAGGDIEALRVRYLNYHPAAGQLMALGDFAFYVVTPRALRFIGGFGHIHWVTAASYLPAVNHLSQQEPDIVAHMNTEHAHNLREYCHHYHGRTVHEARMAGIDCDGFDVRADGELLRFEFERPITDASSAREALVAMAGKARAT